MMLDQRREHANDQAAKQVDAKGADWKGRGEGMTEDEAPEFVARDRTECTAQCDHDSLFCSEHNDDLRLLQESSAINAVHPCEREGKLHCRRRSYPNTVRVQPAEGLADLVFR